MITMEERKKTKDRAIKALNQELEGNETAFRSYLNSDLFLQVVATNNVWMGIAVSFLVSLIGCLGLFGLSSSFAGRPAIFYVPSELVYYLLLLVNLPHLLLLYYFTQNAAKFQAITRIRWCYANLMVNAILSGITIYSTQIGSSFLFETVLIMIAICSLPYYHKWYGFFLVLLSFSSTILVLMEARIRLAWQDQYDIFLFYLICQVIIILRRRWFRQSSWYNYVVNETSGQLFLRSRTDELTGLANRMALREDFPNYLRQNLGIAMIDLDDFKYFNDHYGHAYGDLVLQNLGQFLMDNVANHHVHCYRYGGDEALIIATATEENDFVEQLLLVQWNYARMNKNLESPATLSIGYCTGIVDSEEELRKAIKQADASLYQAKKQGKNKVLGQTFQEQAEQENNK